MIVLHRHLRELRYCNRGSRAFFERHGLSWPTFLREGLPEADFIRTGDAMALRLVEHARRDRNGRG